MRSPASVPPPRPLISCTGIVTIDTVFGVDQLPTGDGKWSAEWFEETGGGVAANAAVAIARLGGRSRFIGCVGTDWRSMTARRGLLAEGVEVDGMHQLEHRSTPTSAVMVDGEGNRMIVNHVASDFFELADPAWASNIEEADVVLVDLRWMAGAAASVTAAQQAGVRSIVDVDRPVPLDAAVLRHATHLLFSADALLTMTGVPRPGDALGRIARIVPGWVGVTLGRDGMLWLDGNTLHHRPAHDIDAVDTLGAGDTFHGAFALALAEGHDEASALAFANTAAAVKCLRRGGRVGMPTREDVESFQQQRTRSRT